MLLPAQELKSTQLWEQAAGPDGTNESWYSGSVGYWDKQEASYDGVLGGFGCVSGIDVRDSTSILTKVRVAWACVAVHAVGAGTAGTCVSSVVSQADDEMQCRARNG
jgi:AdoMet dependent proline di-methyltransferase